MLTHQLLKDQGILIVLHKLSEQDFQQLAAVVDPDLHLPKLIDERARCRIRPTWGAVHRRISSQRSRIGAPVFAKMRSSHVSM